MHRISLGVALVALTVIPVETAFSGNLNFTMVNNTNEPIVRLWTSPTTSPTWYEATNVYVPAEGRSQNIHFDKNAYGSDCYQDIQFRFQDGTTRKVEHAYLCGTSTITVDVDDDGRVTYVAE